MIKIMRMIRKLVAAVLAGVLLSGCLGGLSLAQTASAVSGTYNSLAYTIDDDEDYVIITGYTGSATSVTIPSTIGGKTVKEIAENAFQGNLTLKSIDIPSCVETIGTRAFQGCISLKEIVLPENLTSLGIYAFENCSSLESAKFLFGPTYIPEGAFKNCGSLKKVYFSIAVTKFYSPSLYVYNTEVFAGCSVQDIYYAGTETQWNAVTNTSMADYTRSIYYNATVGRDKTYGDLSYVIEDNHVVITGISSTATSATIPSKIGGLSVTRIASAAFRDMTKLKSVTIPSSVTEIGACAFYGCTNLTTVTLPNSIKTIEPYAFAACTTLKSLTLPSSLQTIEHRAFQGCVSLTSITLPKNLNEIGIYAFENCSSLKTVSFLGGPSYIPEGLFKNCGGLKTIYISKTITSFYSKSWYGSGLNVFVGCSAVQDVYYAGTEAQWNAITNHDVVPGTIHFNTASSTSTGGTTTISGTTNYITGDLDGDDSITINDAYNALQAYSSVAAGLDSGLTDEQMKAADVDGDGKLTIMDAYKILLYYATKSAGGTPSWN